MQQTIETDILCVGAGAAGLIAGVALAGAGHRVALVGRKPPPLHGRTVALFDGSLRLLDRIGLGGMVEAIGQPVRAMRIIDSTNSPFKPGPTFYEAGEIDLDKFGVNIPNDDIVAALDEKAKDFANLNRIEAFVTDYDLSGQRPLARLDDGRLISARVIVAGDGRNSRARQAAGIRVKEWTYPQQALTMILAHRRPHEDATTEYHTRSGPFTFVPMPPRGEARHRSSLVWLVKPAEAKKLLAMPRDELANVIAERADYRYGAVRIEGKIGTFPMTGLTAQSVAARGVMLVGEAAHVFPPLAAQGLNLGIRDSADAADALEGVDLNDDAALKAAFARYEASRKADIDLRTRAVDILNRSLISDFPPVDALRAIGMSAAAHIGPLRRAILREGVDPQAARRISQLLSAGRA